MVNKTVFNSTKGRVPKVNTVNEAGGTAYKFSDEHALCQYVVTGTFNNAYYATAGEQLATVKGLVKNVSSELIAKAAVYGHQTARMKDVPSYLVAALVARGERELVRAIFPRVITNVKMLLNFVQIIRSGETGRRSFGTATKRLIQDWLTSRDGKKLLLASIGHQNPSLADVIKMVHPSPTSVEQENMFAYLIGKPYTFTDLPEIVQHFEHFKADTEGMINVPDVPFRALTNCGLTAEQWQEIAQNMPWNTLRMNLNMLQRNGVFTDKALTSRLAQKLADAEEVRKWNAFPYQLLTTYQNTPDVPKSISGALHDALEVATENVPAFGKDVAVCIDLSGSMSSPVTGGFGTRGPTTKTTCVDVAGLIAACVLRKNPDAKIIAWACSVKEVNAEPRDSVLTNARKFAKVSVGYGTNAQLGLQLLNQKKWKGDVVIYVSDNQSWLHRTRFGGTGMANEWDTFKRRNKQAKLANINIQAYNSTQLPDDGNSVLNIGGFNDSVFNVVESFCKGGKEGFVDVVKEVSL